MQNVYQHILNCRYVKSCLPAWLKWDIGCCFTILLADISLHCCPKQCKSGVRRSSWAKLTGHCCWKGEVLLFFSSVCLPACWPRTPSTSLALALHSSVPSVSCSSSSAVKSHQQLSQGLMSWAGSLQGHLDFRDAQTRGPGSTAADRCRGEGEGGCGTDVFGSSKPVNQLGCLF